MRQLVIPAAGHCERFGAPKLLQEIAGERVVDRTLRMAAGLFDEVLILVAEDFGLPHQVRVASGTGSAGALREVASRMADDVVVIWSDTVLVGPTLEELLRQPLQGTALAPYVPEVRPYCHLSLDASAVADVDYSRPPTGNHDQGLFRFGAAWLREALGVSPSPNLLESFEAMYDRGAPVRAFVTQYPTLGFNDPAKLEHIRHLLQ